MTSRREHDITVPTSGAGGGINPASGEDAPRPYDRLVLLDTVVQQIILEDTFSVTAVPSTSTSATLPPVWPATNAAHLFATPDLATNPPVAAGSQTFAQQSVDHGRLRMVHDHVSGDIVRPKAVLHEERTLLGRLEALVDNSAKRIRERVLPCPPDHTWVPLSPGAQQALAERSDLPIEDIAFSFRCYKSVKTFTTYPISCPFRGCRFLFQPYLNKENFHSHFQYHRAMGQVLSRCDCGEYPIDLAQHFVESHFDSRVKCPFCLKDMLLGACEAHIRGECWGLVDLV